MFIFSLYVVFSFKTDLKIYREPVVEGILDKIVSYRIRGSVKEDHEGFLFLGSGREKFSRKGGV